MQNVMGSVSLTLRELHLQLDPHMFLGLSGEGQSLFKLLQSLTTFQRLSSLTLAGDSWEPLPELLGVPHTLAPLLSVRHLKLRGLWQSHWIPPCPNLEHLQIQAGDLSALSDLSWPPLRTFTLEPTVNEDDQLFPDLRHFPLPHVDCFHVQGTFVDLHFPLEASYHTFLLTFPSISSLSFADFHYPDPVLYIQPSLWKRFDLCTSTPFIFALAPSVVAHPFSRSLLQDKLAAALSAIPLIHLTISLVPSTVLSNDSQPPFQPDPIPEELERVRAVRDILPDALATAIPTLRVLCVGDTTPHASAMTMQPEPYVDLPAPNVPGDDDRRDHDREQYLPDGVEVDDRLLYPESVPRYSRKKIEKALKAQLKLRQMVASASMRAQRWWWIERSGGEGLGRPEMVEIWREDGERACEIIEARDFKSDTSLNGFFSEKCVYEP
ncbi:uncharacterized protein BXZ73DRAFT_76096 [Epithele typhae]|uniref:uncharacterized protein n=1 Tax=Epithele typhae TaxID=378194 RepID=UPI0020075A46|nr:uncharacterized protein BXZ73DRAFT_76096 [Epithele typhae]KAH9939398.1 hypothetical protein BXZ73DRAFT_76096 [Epithele typhae]